MKQRRLSDLNSHTQYANINKLFEQCVYTKCKLYYTLIATDREGSRFNMKVNRERLLSSLVLISALTSHDHLKWNFYSWISEFVLRILWKNFHSFYHTLLLNFKGNNLCKHDYSFRRTHFDGEFKPLKHLHVSYEIKKETIVL